MPSSPLLLQIARASFSNGLNSLSAHRHTMRISIKDPQHSSSTAQKIFSHHTHPTTTMSTTPSDEVRNYDDIINISNFFELCWEPVAIEAATVAVQAVAAVKLPKRVTFRRKPTRFTWDDDGVDRTPIVVEENNLLLANHGRAKTYIDGEVIEDDEDERNADMGQEYAYVNVTTPDGPVVQVNIPVYDDLVHEGERQRYHGAQKARRDDGGLLGGPSSAPHHEEASENPESGQSIEGEAVNKHNTAGELSFLVIKVANVTDPRAVDVPRTGPSYLSEWSLGSKPLDDACGGF